MAIEDLVTKQDLANFIRQLGGKNASALLLGQRRFKTGTFQSHGSTGNQSITGVGFKPSFVRFDLMRNTGAINTSYQIRWGMGLMDGSGQYAQYMAFDPNAATVLSSEFSTSRCVLIKDRQGANVYEASFVSFDADGFTVNVASASTDYRVAWTAFL